IARPGAEPGQQIEARRDLAKAGEMMLDEKAAVIAERLGFDIVLDKVAEALAAVGVGAAAPGLGTAEESKSHHLLLLSVLAPHPPATRVPPSPRSRGEGRGEGRRPEFARGETRAFGGAGGLRP